MTKLKTLAAAVFSFALLAVSNSPTNAQLTKLNVGYSAISGDQLTAWVAKEAGIFQKNGLDAQLIYFTGGTTAGMALIYEDTPVSQSAGAAIGNSELAGSHDVIVAAGGTAH